MKCAVISPIGPGHAESYRNLCRPSIEYAEKTSRGPFSEFVLIPMDDTQGLHGRSNRRNDGIRQAAQMGAEWIFFLDADDFMNMEAFRVFGRHLEASSGALDALFGNICETTAGTDRILVRDGQVPTMSRIEDLLYDDPALTLQMGHFVRTEQALRIGFDPDMDAGEDFKYYLELCSTARWRKVEEVLFVNVRGAHSRGPRAADGLKWRSQVSQVFKDYCRVRDVTATAVSADGTKSRFRITDPLSPEQSPIGKGRWPDLDVLELATKADPGSANMLDSGSRYPVAAAWMMARGADRVDFSPATASDSQDIVRAATETAALNGWEGRLEVREAKDWSGHGFVFSDRRADGAGTMPAAPRQKGKRPPAVVRVGNADILKLIEWNQRNGYENKGTVRRTDHMAYLLAPKSR
jgi:hypothetical protein